MSLPDAHVAGLLDSWGKIKHEGVGRLAVQARSPRPSVLHELKRRWGGSIRGNRWETRSAARQLEFFRFWAAHTHYPDVQTSCESYIRYLEKGTP